VDIFVARQAIFDRKLNIYAYELLYRSRQTDSFDGLDGSEATLQVITNSFLSMGADKILAGVLGFVNCPQNLLADERIELLPLSTTVIEILESVKPEPGVIAACRRLKDLGYRLALDDFTGQPGYEALIDLADIIKVDFRCLDVAGREAICRKRRKNGTRLLAEKVETRMEFQQALEMGYDYFQGYFFARPETVRRREIGGYRANYINILKEIQKPEIDRIKVAELIQREASLTHKLLRYLNSAAFVRANRVGSIAMAITLLGDDGIRKWLLLAALPELAVNKPSELMMSAAIRARMCESIAPFAGLSGRRSDLFLTGMFSFLDAMLDRPLQELLRELHLSVDIREALLGNGSPENRVAMVLDLVRAYETADWDVLVKCGGRLMIQQEVLPDLYLQSVDWAEQIFGGALKSRCW